MADSTLEKAVKLVPRLGRDIAQFKENHDHTTKIRILALWDTVLKCTPLFDFIHENAILIDELLMENGVLLFTTLPVAIDEVIESPSIAHYGADKFTVFHHAWVQTNKSSLEEALDYIQHVSGNKPIEE